MVPIPESKARGLDSEVFSKPLRPAPQRKTKCHPGARGGRPPRSSASATAAGEREE